MGKAAIDPFVAMVHECQRLIEGQRYAEAEVVCRQILARSSAHPDALHLLGVIAYRAHRYGEAAELIRKAIGKQRNNPSFHNNLGLALQATGDSAAAIKSFRQAVTARPDNADYHSNLGNAFKDAGEIENAVASFRRAIALDPALASGHFGRALCLLLLGQLREAWREHEWRVPYDRGTPYITDPRGRGGILPRPSQLAGTDLRGKRILALMEQGLGDELFFLRGAAGIRRKGAWLAYSGSARLAPLLRRGGAIDLVIEQGQPLPDADHTVLVGDLLLVAGDETGADAPPAFPLIADAAALERAAAIVHGAGPAPYLAVTWRAGNTARAGRGRTLTKSVPIEGFARAVAGWPGTVLVVQRGPTAEELSAFGHASGLPIADLSAANDDLDLMLGVLSVAHEYAGVSNTNMHLRAGLALSARVLVPLPAEWRWTLNQERSPWFPAFPLYREDKRSGWSAALSRLAADLMERK